MKHSNVAKSAVLVLFAFALLFSAGFASAQGTAEAVLKDGSLLEKQQRWESALELYENALRLFPEDTQLQRHYTLAKQYSNLHRRMMDSEYLQLVAKMTDQQERNFATEIFQAVEKYYLNPLACSDVFQRGVMALQVALSDVDFCEKVLPNASVQLREDFRRYLESLDGKAIATREDLEQAFSRLAARGEQTFHVNSAYFTMECLIGFVYSLDPYSAVLVPSQYRDLLSGLKGQLVGIGVRLHQRDGQTWIYQVVENSPAQKAGLRGGELLQAVDGKTTEGLSLEQVSLLLQGEENSTVKLTLRTKDSTTKQPVSREVAISRSALVLPSIGSSQILSKETGIAYIQLQHFQNGTAKELDRVLWDLYNQGMTKLVLDLRGNPGGVLRAAVETADLFVAEGILVSTQGNQQTEGSTVYHAKKAGTWRVPLEVLIDEHSASCSEIFAGAIQDHQRGKLIGSRSYGKGLVQRIYPIPGMEDFALRLTTSQYFSPNGQKINLAGVEPDVKVYKALFPKAPEAEEAEVQPYFGTTAKRMFADDEALRVAVESFSPAQ